MNTKFNSKHYIDTVATLLIFAVFALCIVISILFGADIYKSINERDSLNYEFRTCRQYISNKVNMAQSPDCVSVCTLDSCNALRIEEHDVSDGIYTTYVYCYDGWLREIYCPADELPLAVSGEKLLEIDDICFELDNGLLFADILSDDKTETVYMNVRGLEVSK